jgi:DNA-binding phage protein
VDGPPISYVTAGEWPYGTIEDPIAGYAQEVARRLAQAIGEKSFRSVARQAGVDHTTIMAVVRGERWPDLITLARLEVALNTRLWPDQPR